MQIKGGGRHLVNTQKEKKSLRRTRVIRYAFILCAVLIACVMVFMTQAVVNRGMRNHQLQMVEMVASRINENMNHYFQGQWDNIRHVRNTLEQRVFTDQKGNPGLSRQRGGFHADQLSGAAAPAHRRRGLYYSADAGKIALWRSPNTAYASSELDREESVSISSLAELDSEATEYLCFTRRLEEPVTALDGSRFTHMVLATDKSIFDIDLSLASFGTITDAFVMNSQGKIINAQQASTELAKAYNLVKTLEQAEFSIGNTYDELKAAPLLPCQRHQHAGLWRAGILHLLSAHGR